MVRSADAILLTLFIMVDLTPMEENHSRTSADEKRIQASERGITKRLSSAAEGASSFLKFLFTSFLILFFFTLAGFVLQQRNKMTYVVEPFEVSGLWSEGYKVSGNAVAKRLADRLNHIKNTVRTRRSNKWEEFNTRRKKEEIVIEAFDSKLNLTAAMQVIVKFFGGGPKTIEGEIVAIPESANPFYLSVKPTGGENNITLELSLRIQGEPGQTFSESFVDFNKLIARAADYCYEVRGPYWLALFYLQEFENPRDSNYYHIVDNETQRGEALNKAKRFAISAVDKDPGDPWAHLLLGIIFTHEYESTLRGPGPEETAFDIALASFETAINRAKERMNIEVAQNIAVEKDIEAAKDEVLAPIYSGLGKLHKVRGDFQKALRYYRNAYSKGEDDHEKMLRYADLEREEGEGTCKAAEVLLSLYKRRKEHEDKRGYFEVQDNLDEWCLTYDLSLEKCPNEFKNNLCTQHSAGGLITQRGNHAALGK